METEDGITKSRNVKTDKEYSAWIRELKQRYKAAKIKAAIKVNAEQLRFNWCLGRDLVLMRAEEKWGKGIVEQAALDLQAEFPNAKGFSVSNLFYMKKWFQFFSLPNHFEKVQQVAAELGAPKMSKNQQSISENNEKYLSSYRWNSQDQQRKKPINYLPNHLEKKSNKLVTKTHFPRFLDIFLGRTTY